MSRFAHLSFGCAGAAAAFLVVGSVVAIVRHPDILPRLRPARPVLTPPAGAEAPLALACSVRSRDVSPARLRTLATQVVRPRLQVMPGVARVDVIGGASPEVEVRVDAARLEAHGILADEVARALAASSGDVSGGALREPSTGRLPSPGAMRVAGIEDLMETVVAFRGGVPVRVRDLATVSAREVPDPRGSLSREGVPCVLVTARLLPDAPDDAAARLLERARGLALEMPAAVHIESAGPPLAGAYALRIAPAVTLTATPTDPPPPAPLVLRGADGDVPVRVVSGD